MRWSTALLVWVGLMVVGITPLWAESPSLLTLESAIETAIQNNPQLQAARLKLGVSEANVLTAGARLNPTAMSDNGIAEKTYRIGIEQTLELGGKRRHRIAVASAQQRVVLAEINTLTLDLKTHVRRTFAQLYNDQERQRATQEILQTTRELVDIAKKREAAGDISSLDVLQAEIVQVTTHNELQTVQAQMIQERNRLNSLLNQPLSNTLELSKPSLSLPETNPPDGSTDAPLKGDITVTAVPDLAQLISTALSNRPELHQVIHNTQVAKEELALARANRVPNLSVTAGPDIVDNGPTQNVSVFIIGNMQIPLYNRQQGPIKAAIAEQKRLTQEQVALENQVKLEVTNAYNALTSSQERLLRYETELLPKAQTVLSKSRSSFQEGKSSILTPIQAQQAYISTRLGYLQAMLDAQHALSDLERAIGTD